MDLAWLSVKEGMLEVDKYPQNVCGLDKTKLIFQHITVY